MSAGATGGDAGPGPQAETGPRFAWVAWKMAKAAVRKPSALPHLLSALAGLRRTLPKLRASRQARDGRHAPALTISLIEHMGDIVAAEPVARHARREHPDAPIAWICRDPYREVVAAFPEVDEVVTVRCMTGWLLLWAALPGKVWDLHISERACPVCGISYRKPGPPGQLTRDTYYDHGNLLAVNCRAAGLPVLDEAPRLAPGGAAARRVDELGLPGRFVAVHCRSNEESRDWDTGKWRALAAWIAGDAGVPVCEVGGAAGVAVERDGALTRDLCGKLAPTETAEVIRRAALFVGVDSGPAHLANAVGTPGVVLLGRYHRYERYMPYSGGYADGSRADLVRGGEGRPARDIPLEAVRAAVARRLRASYEGGDTA